MNVIIDKNSGYCFGVAGLPVQHNLAILPLRRIKGVLHAVLKLKHHRARGVDELDVVLQGQLVGFGRLAVGPDEHLAVVELAQLVAVDDAQAVLVEALHLHAVVHDVA